MYLPIHSDFIIHWTGKDIDKNFDKDLCKNNSSDTNEDVTSRYLIRFKNILKHGLWMTSDDEEKTIKINNKTVERPLVSRTCFTELKLSEARYHAEKYGRLGIGFKRFFLFDRFGGPMIYFCPDKNNFFFLPSFKNGNKYPDDAYYSCFLKPMYPPREGNDTIRYDYYDESEWRIIYSEEMDKHVPGIAGFIKKPKDWPEDFKNYLNNESYKIERKPDFLIPLTKDSEKVCRWFAIIIYPSLRAKVEAERDIEIRQLIEGLKPKISNQNHRSEEKCIASNEKNSKPFEINLDACRNF